MKYVYTVLLSLFSPIIAFCAEETFDQKINSFVKPVTEFVSSIVFYSFNIPIGDDTVAVPFVLLWLLAGAIFFTIYFRLVNIRRVFTSIQVVKGKYSEPDDPGEVTHFQALTAALSATVGLGNIAGVAVAITLGGPGAVLWMIVAGLLGMSSKFAECTLGVKFRKIDQDGVVHGGPMYYLRDGLAGMNYKKLGKVLAVIFAIAAVGGSLGAGNMFQSNQAFSQFSTIPVIQGTWLADRGWVFGILMAVLVGIVIIGGIRSIAKVTDKIVPFMCGVYIIGAFVVLAYNSEKIGPAFGEIIDGAFAPFAIAGGIIGVMVQGFKRAAFSNEAGIGSAAIAHSAVKTKYPASEGLVALLEPFIDTVVVCTITALVIIVTGMWKVDAKTIPDQNTQIYTYWQDDAPVRDIDEKVYFRFIDHKDYRVAEYEDEVSTWKYVSLVDPVTKEETGEMGWVKKEATENMRGIPVTSTSFEEAISWFPQVLTIAVILFAFSTMISWSYYGMQAWEYLFGVSKKSEYVYKGIFCLCIIAGSASQLEYVIGLSDSMLFLMAFPNILGVVMLSPVVRKELNLLMKKIKTGEARTD